MTEPKTIARSIAEIVPGLFHFSIQDERIKSQSDAYALVANDRVTLVDPILLDPTQLQRLGKVEAVVIGTPSHQRAAWSYRREHKAKVYAPLGWKDLEEKPDAEFKTGDPLPGGLKPLHAPGPATSHHAFIVDTRPGALLCTDLWHVGREGVEFLPDKYMNDKTRARDSARRLMELDFDILCLGHGDPILRDAKRALAEVIRKDAAKG
jgi:glyoxylase-like metal-dependent hydrolase (beta-lactamase superfamily II)